jgi:hypothetical protein
MESATPLDVITEQARAARRAKAFALIEKPPSSMWTQTIVLIFAYAMLGLIVFINYSPFLILSLIPAVIFVAANGLNTQRRLEALIEIVKQDSKRS